MHPRHLSARPEVHWNPKDLVETGAKCRIYLLAPIDKRASTRGSLKTDQFVQLVISIRSSRLHCNLRLPISICMRWCLGHSVPTDGNTRHCNLLPRDRASMRPATGCTARSLGCAERSSGAASYQQSRKRQRFTYQAAVLSDAATEEAQQLDALLDSSGSAAAAAATALSPASVGRIVSPDDLTLQPGELSRVDRTGACSAADVFRCASCTEPACQVPHGR